jgi:hypothetical protein
MTLSWEISLGQIVLSVPLGFILLSLWTLNRKITLFRIEHEYLMADWAERKGIRLKELPTRTRSIF